MPTQVPDLLDTNILVHLVRMGKNDLWIAAVANVTGFRLLTTDANFDHLDPVFLNHVRITYDQGTEKPL